MFDFLKLRKEVSETTADIEPDDVLSIKRRLKGLGYYEEPEWGMTKFTDNQMFDGIRKFQTDNKLKVDGIMKPDGETQNAINYKSNLSSFSQAKGALSDMYKNYKYMRKDNVIGNDDYFHCKANFEATQRGKWGEKMQNMLEMRRNGLITLRTGLKVFRLLMHMLTIIMINI